MIVFFFRWCTRTLSRSALFLVVIFKYLDFIRARKYKISFFYFELSISLINIEKQLQKGLRNIYDQVVSEEVLYFLIKIYLKCVNITLLLYRILKITHFGIFNDYNF